MYCHSNHYRFSPVVVCLTLRHSRNQNNKFLKERVSQVDAKNQKKILEPE
jgi:hypothetical protein